MSLFTYIIDLPNQKGKAGRITAKTETDARQQVAAKYPEGENLVLEAESQPTKKAAKKKVAKKAAPKTPASGLTKLEKILYLQSGKCFFCGESLPIDKATIEHLNPKSKGGTSTADNEVVCCAELNHTFGDMELKRKFEFILKAAGQFKCPKPKARA